MKKAFEQIEKEIRAEFIGGRYEGETATEEQLTEIIGQSVEWYDTYIVDGVDDDETEDMYVMKSCFSTKDDSITIRIYYGDVTEEITYIGVSNN